MHFKTFSLFLSLFALISLGACGKKLKSDQVIESVVISMCKKLVTCQPGAMPNEEFCQKTMKDALQSGKGKEIPKVSATQKQLDVCLQGITGADCANLLGAEPPKGCEFLK